jgi:hypothetical protein
MNAAIIQLRDQLAAQDVDDVTAVAPMVREVAGGIANHADASAAELQRARQRGAGFAGVLDFRDGGPVSDDKWGGDSVLVLR